MTTPLNSEQSLNELLFENRNKEYGAFAIRNSYHETMTKSLGITMTIVVLFVTFFVYLSNANSAININTEAFFPPEVSITQVHVQKPELPPEPKLRTEMPKEPVPASTDNLNLVVTDNKEPIDLKPVEKMNIGATTVKGADSTVTDANVPMDPPKTDPDKIERFATDMPEFEGDMYGFIRKHLRYPQIAVENNTQGTVGLSFVVEKDGSIGNINVLGGVPDGCTEEAIKVVKMMPKWKPGRNHGELVRVQFNIPIKFILK